MGLVGALLCGRDTPYTFARRQRSQVFRHRPEPVTAEKSAHVVSGRVRTQVVASEMDKV